MDIFPTRIRQVSLGAAVIGLFLAGACLAQSQNTNAPSTPSPEVNAESCAKVNWQPQLLKAYPKIADACQEVILSPDGKMWARFNGKLLSSPFHEEFVTAIMDRQGKPFTTMRLRTPEDQKVWVKGKAYNLSELHPGQELHLYIPEESFHVATEMNEPPAEMAEIVTPATQEETVATTELPQTAGPLPWVLVTGAGILLVGLGLTLWRRLSTR